MTENGRRAAIIDDVARLAGVSVPTVSRVLTGSAPVSPDKRERVLAAIAELDFRPSAAARALVSKKQHTIAVVAGNTSRYGYAETIRGIEEAARAVGLTVTITVVDSDADEEADRAVALLLEQNMRGVVVLAFDAPGVAVLERLPRSVPVVAVSGLRNPRVAQAMLDEQQGADDLTSYVLARGHRTVHHVRIPPSRHEDARTTGWRIALQRAGAPVPPILDAGWDPASGRPLGRALAADGDVTAVFCGNDEIAMGVVRGIEDAGLRVPQDISVAGFDDHPIAALWSPALTTVDLDFAGLGARGFALLDPARADGPEPPFSIEQPRLIVRDSVGSVGGARSGA